MEAPKKPTIPKWVWIVPVLFGPPGGIISWFILRKRENAGWLIVVGFIVTILSNMIFQAVTN